MNQPQSKGLFDRVATSVADQVSRAWFFACCVATVVIWLPTILLIQSLDTWQLIINTYTTIVTFLLLALLQNTQRRDSRAIHFKNDATATGLRDLMKHVKHTLPCDSDQCDFQSDIHRLEEAIGIEEEVGTKKDESE